jgi:hypothetical protein
MVTEKFENEIKNLNLTKEEIQDKKINNLLKAGTKKIIHIRELGQQIYGNYKYTPQIHANSHITSTFAQRQNIFNQKVNENLNK